MLRVVSLLHISVIFIQHLIIFDFIITAKNMPLRTTLLHRLWYRDFVHLTP